MQKMFLELGGMGCGGCVKNVRKILGAVPGVVIDDVVIGSAKLTYDASATSPQNIVDALTNAGYPAREATAAPAGSAGGEGGHCGIAS